MKGFLLLIAALCVAGGSCERHEFDGPDGTRRLHEHHADHAEDKPGSGH